MSAGINILDASADRSLSGIHIIDGSSADRTITQGRVIGPDKVDRIFWDPSGTFSFSVTTDADVASGVAFGTSSATAGPVTATASGGTAPYSYAWSREEYSHPTTAPTATAPSSAASSFTQTNMSNLAGRNSCNATFKVTATDSSTPPNTAIHEISVSWTFIS